MLGSLCWVHDYCYVALHDYVLRHPLTAIFVWPLHDLSCIYSVLFGAICYTDTFHTLCSVRLGRALATSWTSILQGPQSAIMGLLNTASSSRIQRPKSPPWRPQQPGCLRNALLCTSYRILHDLGYHVIKCRVKDLHHSKPPVPSAWCSQAGENCRKALVVPQEKSISNLAHAIAANAILILMSTI